MKDNRLTRTDRPPMPESAEGQLELRMMYENRGFLTRLNDIVTPLETAIVGTSSCLYEFFHSNGYEIQRTEWDQNTIVPSLCAYRGWVYAFYYQLDTPIYVGETSRTFKERFTEHKSKDWWPDWTGVKVLPCPNQSMRKVFESLIGLAGGHVENKLQPSGGDNVFDEVLLSLLALGNDDDNRLPTFPNKMVGNWAKCILEKLPDGEKKRIAP